MNEKAGSTLPGLFGARIVSSLLLGTNRFSGPDGGCYKRPHLVAAARHGGERVVFRHVVGYDGAHSAVRRALGIAFEGDAFPMMFMLGDVHIDWDLPRGMALRALLCVPKTSSVLIW